MNLSITLEQPDKRLALFGTADRHLRMIREAFGVQVVGRDEELRLAGEREQVAKAAAVLDQMQRKLRRQDWLTVEDIGNAIRSAIGDTEPRGQGELDVYTRGRFVKPKTAGQIRYV
ncbi:MAG: hypothetical protein ACM359_13055, partial [Bacillota bacterium]